MMDVEKEIDEIRDDIRLIRKELAVNHELYMNLCDRFTKTEDLVIKIVDFLGFKKTTAM